MKISRKQIRRLVREEANRELPITYYSDDMLMHEGLLDMLGGLFGGLVDFFSKAFDKAEGDVKGLFTSAGDKVNSFAEKLLGKEEAADIKSIEDLDMKKEDHQKIFYATVAEPVIEGMKAGMTAIENAANVEDWTPADDSDEAVKEWQETNGEAANGLWQAFGTMGGTVSWFGDQGISAASDAMGGYDTAAESGNPAEAVTWMAGDGAKAIKQTYEFAKTIGIKEAEKVMASADELAAAAGAIGEKIAASGEEQQKESLELRKMINHMIIQERRIIKSRSGR